MTTIVTGIECGICGYRPSKEEKINPGKGDKCPLCGQKNQWLMIGEMLR